MRVEQLMMRPVRCCRPDDTLAEAAKLMWDHDCGCLPVANAADASVVGMITDRDICMCALFQNEPLHELTVSQAMAKEVLACRPGDSLADAERTMREARLRRLPVIDDSGVLVGMVSLADLAQQAARESTAAQAQITEIEVGDTLAAISQPQNRRDLV